MRERILWSGGFGVTAALALLALEWLDWLLEETTGTYLCNGFGDELRFNFHFGDYLVLQFHQLTTDASQIFLAGSYYGDAVFPQRLPGFALSLGSHFASLPNHFSPGLSHRLAMLW